MHDPLSWRFLPMGEAAMLLDATENSELRNRQVLFLAECLKQQPITGLMGSVPAMSSLLLLFDPLQLSSEQLCDHVRELLADAELSTQDETRLVSIPVRYGGDYGPDLEWVAERCGMAPEQLIDLHCAHIYRVMMIGFAPGFPYIGMLPPQLHVPRRTTPRSSLPAGSVAVAAGLTGIYPTCLPGGWHIIGHTQLPMFDPSADPPSLLMAGDRVRFVQC